MKNVLLYTIEKENALLEIEELGGRIVQQFSNNLFSAELPEDFTVNVLKNSTDQIPEQLDEPNQLAYNSWNRWMNKIAVKDLNPDFREGLSWNTEGFEPPKSLMPLFITDVKSGEIKESTGTPTSLYMIGSVAVGIVIVSGPGILKIDKAEAELVVSEVQEGLDFLAKTEPRAKVSFIYDTNVITVSTTPGNTGDYESAEAPWRNEALGKMGFQSNRNGSIDYVNNLIKAKKTEWGYVAYFTKYPLHHFAYAIGEKLVMHYDNDGWGTDLINRVFAHESCHIFGAADEYGNCRCDSIHGYLSIKNGNCRSCSPNSTNCLMDRNELVLCEWSRKQIGWDEKLFPSIV